MAATLKNSDSQVSRMKTAEKLARSFKLRFDALDCPFVDGVDESWISELLFQPGEARVRLLQWLLSRYDSKFSDMLDSQYWTSETKMDARLQAITKTCSCLGLCRPGDLDLVRGVSTSHSKQAAFWDKLLDIVYLSDASDESNTRGMLVPGVVSDNLPLWEQFWHNCHFVSSLAHGRDLQEALSTKQNLLPPDIARSLQKRAASDEQAVKDRFIPPDTDTLMGMTMHLTMELQQANQHLMDLKAAYPYPEQDPKGADRVCQTLKLVLSELVQFVTSFTYSFEGEIRQWCHKSPPNLTPLGSAVKRVHALLQEFTRLLSSLRSMHTSYHSILNTKGAWLGEKEPSEKTDLLASVSQATLKSYGDFMSVVEESIHRHRDAWSESRLLSESFR